MEHSMHGPAGFAALGELDSKDLQALQALGRSHRITHLLHLPMYGSFYLADTTETATSLRTRKPSSEAPSANKRSVAVSPCSLSSTSRWSESIG